MARHDRLPPDPTDFDPTARPDKETPGLQVHEARLSTFSRTGTLGDTTDIDWRATPVQPERTPVPPPAPVLTSTPGPTESAVPPADSQAQPQGALAPLATRSPIPPAARAVEPGPAEPVRFEPPPPLPQAVLPAATPAPPRPRREPMPFLQRAMQVTVLSILAGGLAAVGAVVASALTPATEGLSVIVPADPAGLSAPAGVAPGVEGAPSEPASP